MFRGMICDPVQLLQTVAAGRGGVARLAREAGVAESTVRSLADRQWKSKPVETFDKLLDAARRIAAEQVA